MSISEMFELERRDEDYDLMPAILDRAAQIGWASILQDVLEILSNKERQEDWQSAANVIYWSDVAKTEMPIPKMAVVARLTWCQIVGEGLDNAENLVWSIAKELKGVNYESEWDPIKDPEVSSFLAELP